MSHFHDDLIELCFTFCADEVVLSKLAPLHPELTKEQIEVHIADFRNDMADAHSEGGDPNAIHLMIDSPDDFGDAERFGVDDDGDRSWSEAQENNDFAHDDDLDYSECDVW